jgi:mono/diheme cytochrome c family protein
MSISPNAVGTNSFQIFIFPPAGEELAEILRIRLRFKPPDPELGPSEIIAEKVAPNFFKAVGTFFTQPGDWEVQVDLRRREVEDVSAFFQVSVAGTRGGDVAGRFDLPLVAGSWGTVAAVGGLMAAILMYLWSVQWSFLPRLALRYIRVGSIAGTLIGVAVLAESLLSGTGSGDSASANPIPATAQSIAIGRGLFQSNCASCHGVSGYGDGPLATGLAVPPADFRIHIPFHSDEFFFLVMTGGYGTLMPAFGEILTDEERWHILNFLQSEFGIDASPP